MESKEFNIDYKTLRNRIIRSTICKGNGIVDFQVDFNKLSSQVEELGLTPIHFGLDATRITPGIIPYLNEYFKDENLTWITDNKFYTAISFINTNYIDEKAQEYLDKLKVPQVDDPNIDRVNIVANLLAKYPCYTATIISYKSNNPRFIKSVSPSYVIQIRANKIIIENSNYQYNYKDFS